MATKIFKFKHTFDYTGSPDNFTKSPAFGTIGEDGKIGETGENGTSIFFVNYELNNSYYKSLALQRIENGRLLSSNRSMKIGRSYRNGDLILTKGLFMYKIIESPTQNSKFDLEYMGKIITKDSADVLNSVDVIPVIYYDASLDSSGFLPNHVTMSTANYDHRDIIFSFTPKLLLTDEQIDTIQTDYDLYLEIQLHNTKTLGEQSVLSSVVSESTSPSQISNIVSIYKTVELPIYKDASAWTTTKVNLLEADMLHPSGSDISTTFVKNCVAEYDPTTYGSIYDSSTKQYTNYILGTNGTEDYTMNIYSGSDTPLDVSALVNSSYKDSSMAIKYTMTDASTEHRNFRAGESGYFSGMDSSEQNTSKKYSDYVNDSSSTITKDFMKTKFIDFVKSTDNAFIMMFVRKSDGYVRYIDVTENITFQQA